MMILALTFSAALGAYCYWELPAPWNFIAPPDFFPAVLLESV